MSQSNTLNFSIDETGQQLLSRNLLRCLPDKRLVFESRLDKQPVVVKLFFHKRNADRHWKREAEGLELLKNMHILAPDILSQGSMTCLNAPEEIGITSGRKGYGLVLPLLPDAVNLRTLWHSNASLEEKTHWYKKALLSLAEQHEKGIIQQDLHLGNFLISNNTLYVIDGDSVISKGQPLEASESWQWVGVFFAQIFPQFNYLLEKLLPDYCIARGISFEREFLAEVEEARRRQREKIKKSHLDKIYRNSGLCRVNQGFFQLIICDNNYDSPKMRMFLSELHKSGADGKGNRPLFKIELEGETYWVQWYTEKVKTQRRWLPESGASLRWQQAHLATVFGEKTEQSVAVGIKKIGPFHCEGFYIFQ